MKKRKYRIKSKFRFTIFSAAVLVLAVFLTGTALGANDAASLSEEPSYIQVEIMAGDTLWNIASEYGPKDVDRRRIVYEICQINEIDAGSIRPGQAILIPEQI